MRHVAVTRRIERASKRDAVLFIATSSIGLWLAVAAGIGALARM